MWHQVIFSIYHDPQNHDTRGIVLIQLGLAELRGLHRSLLQTVWVYELRATPAQGTKNIKGIK